MRSLSHLFQPLLQAISAKGLKGNLQTDYILKILGLDICADTLVGDAMRRGISGGQKKRLTTGEMIVGPTKALFMEEIANGLDSSTAFQIVTCPQQLVHITDATLVITACIMMTVFLRTRMDIDILHANYYMGSLFFALIIHLVDAIPELSTTIQRLEVFYKQKTFCFYPARAYAIPAMYLSSLSMFRFLASVFQTNNASMTAASMPVWLKWAFWVSPITYGEMGLFLNEFLAPRWQKLDFDSSLFNKHLAPGLPRAVILREKLSQIRGSEDSCDGSRLEKKSGNSPAQNSIEPNKGRTVLLFTPLTIVFQDVQYYVDIHLEMREKGFTNKKLQILSDVTGALKPGVLTALMGVSGAGKTTLLNASLIQKGKRVKESRS
uniref:ABC transporter domain-containing protein n=1 Tax=Quercus lobata TaxID=97700 RepID=A0A7N2L584_QUELO